MEMETKILNENNKVPEMPDTLCLVCNAEECSLHFGVMTCAACCAFFRRSIAAKKVYKCQNGNYCKITHGFSFSFYILIADCILFLQIRQIKNLADTAVCKSV
jgi:hypothetical protein